EVQNANVPSFDQQSTNTNLGSNTITVNTNASFPNSLYLVGALFDTGATPQTLSTTGTAFVLDQRTAGGNIPYTFGDLANGVLTAGTQSMTVNCTAVGTTAVIGVGVTIKPRQTT